MGGWNQIELFLSLGIPLFLLVLAWVAGTSAERSHVRDLDRREAILADMALTNTRTIPETADRGRGARMVTGEVVISSDYLKTFLAGLKNLLGGEMKSMITLTNRARREAVARLLEEARRQGFNAVCNVRLDTANITGAAERSGNGMVAICLMASGTAYYETAPAPAHRGKAKTFLTTGWDQGELD